MNVYFIVRVGVGVSPPIDLSTYIPLFHFSATHSIIDVDQGILDDSSMGSDDIGHGLPGC